MRLIRPFTFYRSNFGLCVVLAACVVLYACASNERHDGIVLMGPGDSSYPQNCPYVGFRTKNGHYGILKEPRAVVNSGDYLQGDLEEYGSPFIYDSTKQIGFRADIVFQTDDCGGLLDKMSQYDCNGGYDSDKTCY